MVKVQSSGSAFELTNFELREQLVYPCYMDYLKYLGNEDEKRASEVFYEFYDDWFKRDSKFASDGFVVVRRRELKNMVMTCYLFWRSVVDHECWIPMDNCSLFNLFFADWIEKFVFNQTMYEAC